MPPWIHRGNMFVSGEAWRRFQEAHPDQDFSDFWLEVSLRFSMECFDLSSFFIRVRIPLLRTQTLRGFRRWSPLALSPPSSTLPMLAILRNTIAANHHWTFVIGILFFNVIDTNLCRNFYATKAIKTFSLKKRHPPPPCRFAWKFRGKLKKFYCSSVILIIYAFEKFSRVLKWHILRRKSTKFVCKFCGLDLLGILALVDTATLSCFNHNFIRIFTRAPCPFYKTYSLHGNAWKRSAHMFA
jgi:hypothetical protein